MAVTDKHRCTVLLVDDDRDLTDLLASCLRTAGYEVVVASNGREALALIQESPASIRLLVTEVEMPFLSGTELARTAGAAGCPVLLISGRPLPAEEEHRGWEFLAKPFLPNALQRAVRDILDRTAGSPAVPDAPPRPRVILAEDDAEVRRRLCRLLVQDYDVVAALAEGAGVLEKAEELRPDVILLDIGMPGMNGFAVARVLRRSVPWAPLLFVTQHAEPAYVEEAFRTGVAGYVLKRNVVAELAAAIEQVRGGGRYLSPGLQAA